MAQVVCAGCGVGDEEPTGWEFVCGKVLCGRCRERAAPVFRARGWGPGLVLRCADNISTPPRFDDVRITALGEQEVLGVWVTTRKEGVVPLAKKWVPL